MREKDGYDDNYAHQWGKLQSCFCARFNKTKVPSKDLWSTTLISMIIIFFPSFVSADFDVIQFKDRVPTTQHLIDESKNNRFLQGQRRVIVCGSSSKVGENNGCYTHQETASRSSGTMASVRCCSNFFKNDWKKFEGCQVWSADICRVNKTYYEAKNICKNEGGRLCTAGEIFNDCTFDKNDPNPKCDSDYVWSSSMQHHSESPSQHPTEFPTTKSPSSRPTTRVPTPNPSSSPSSSPTALPTSHPTLNPSKYPTAGPSLIPSSVPSIETCPEDPFGIFYLREGSDGIPILQSCLWLMTNNDLKNICVRHQSWTDVDSGMIIPAARYVCLNTCRNCEYNAPTSSPTLSSKPTERPSYIASPPPSIAPTPKPTQRPTISPTACEENPNAVFFYKINPIDLEEVFQNCSWLRNSNTAREVIRICKQTAKSKTGIAPARYVCLDACKRCHPTELPSATPSLTLIPSQRPSHRPSSSPTDTPTIKPSPHPTSVPTFQPAPKPSLLPTIIPTDRHSKIFTSPPTNHPTLTPSLFPSILHTQGPSSATSSSPSHSPTQQPSAGPSALLSTEPSLSPTIHPSLSPSVRLTSQTWQPSLTRSNSPTSAPSEVIDNPSTSPTYPLQVAASDRLGFTLSGINSLSKEAVGKFEEVVGARVKKNLDDLYGDEFTTDTTVISTQSFSSGGRSRNLQANRRFLQQSTLYVVTELTAQTRSATLFTSNMITEGVLKSFGTNIELQAFISELSLKDSSFALVSSIDFRIGGDIEVLKSREKEGGISSWGVVGISLGSATVVLTSLLAAASCRKRKNRDRDGHHGTEDSGEVNSRLDAYATSGRPFIDSENQQGQNSSDDTTEAIISPYRLSHHQVDATKGDNFTTSLQSRNHVGIDARSIGDISQSIPSSVLISIPSSMTSNRASTSCSRDNSSLSQQVSSNHHRSRSRSHGRSHRSLSQNERNERSRTGYRSSTRKSSSHHSSSSSRFSENASRGERSVTNQRSSSKHRSRSSRSMARSERSDTDSRSRNKESRRSLGRKYRRGRNRSHSRSSTNATSCENSSRSKRGISEHRQNIRLNSSRSSSRPKRRSHSSRRNASKRQRGPRSSRRSNSRSRSSRRSNSRSRSSRRSNSRSRSSRRSNSRSRSSRRSNSRSSTRSYGSKCCSERSSANQRSRNTSSNRNRSRSFSRSRPTSRESQSSSRCNTRDIAQGSPKRGPHRSSHRSKSHTRDDDLYNTSHGGNARPRILTVSRDIKSGEEKILEVTMSPGKLGFVVDAPLSGSPVVHAVKHTSVLREKIKIGDKLLSVDGVDTNNMSAKDVSTMIKERINNPRRILVFQRPK